MKVLRNLSWTRLPALFAYVAILSVASSFSGNSL